jgi:DNA-binding IclR family transcriptional regulator
MVHYKQQMSKLENAIRVLRSFSTTDGELSVSRVAERLRLPKSSISRLMKEMREQDLLEQDPVTRLYRPGFFLFQLGMIYQAHLNIFGLVITAVEQLVQESGHTAYIGMLDGGDLLALRTIQGRHPVRYVVEAGQRIPAYSVTSGKCLLSRMDDETIRRLYSEPLDKRFPKSPRTMAQLLAEVRETRKRGWAEAEVSTLPGVRAIGVSISTADQNEAFGYSLSFPNGALSRAERDDLRVKIIQSALTLSTQTADPVWAKIRNGGSM